MSDFETREAWLAVRATKPKRNRSYLHVSTSQVDRKTGQYQFKTLDKGATETKAAKQRRKEIVKRARRAIKRQQAAT